MCDIFVTCGVKADERKWMYSVWESCEKYLRIIMWIIKGNKLKWEVIMCMICGT